MKDESVASEARAALKATIIERLREDSIQDSLAEVVLSYYADARRVATLAETMSEGMRFDGLSNEVYACFQHISRGLCESDVEPLDELSKAKNSHIKRLLLDGYKIVINRSLRDAKPVLDAIDFLSSNSEVVRMLPEGVGNIARVRALRSETRDLYLSAKRAEGRGEPEKVALYERAMNSAGMLLSEVEHFSGTNEVLFALKRDAENRLQGLQSIEEAKNSNKIAEESNKISMGARGLSIWSILIAGVSSFVALGALLWAIFGD